VSADAAINLITGASTGLGVLGLLFVLFMLGQIHSDREFQREVSHAVQAEARAVTAEARAEKETEARRHLEDALADRTREANVANARADAAVRASEIIADALGSRKAAS
jgi:hypothetical protein